MAHPVFEFTQQLPADYARLLWQVFFIERSRGQRLERHFPWLLHANRDVWFACLREDSELRCGLTVRALPAYPKAGALGLVCVDASQRGRGWGGHLLDRSIQALDELGFECLTLWTGKPAVYARLGFKIEDSGCYGTVRRWPRADLKPSGPQFRRWPDSREVSTRARGLPAFARDAQRIWRANTSAELLVLQDTQGTALAEWRGPDTEVIQLLADVMPPAWRLNALRHDTLLAALEGAGADLDLADSQLQMWRCRPGSPAGERPQLRLLDRI